MSDVAVAAPAGWRGKLGTVPSAARPPVDARRALQLALAATWLLDGVLQYQGFMFTTGFSQLLAGTANGDPAVVAKPITWDATLIGHHLVLLNAIFATIQLLVGLGIAFRPTVRAALAASVLWSVAVWWLGEGLGGVLNGTASPLNGAPGAVIIYALLAMLLWPAERPVPAPFVAGRTVGADAARALWALLWLSLAYFALTPANRAAQGVNGMIAGMESGEPTWLQSLEKGAASLVAGQGLATSVVLAVALAVIAVGVYLPARITRVTLMLGIVVAAFIWVFGEALGGVLAGGATDVNSGPLLALLALAYWPPRTGNARQAAAGVVTEGAAAC